MKNRTKIADYLLSKGAEVNFKTNRVGVQQIIRGMNVEFKAMVGGHVKSRSLRKLLFAFHNRNKVDKKDWPELFVFADKYHYVLRTACKYLAADFDLDTYLDYA